MNTEALKFNKECKVFTICSSLLTSQSGADIFWVALIAGTCTNKRKQFSSLEYMLTHTFSTLTLFEHSPDTNKSCVTFLKKDRKESIANKLCLVVNLAPLLASERVYRRWPFNTQS